MEQTKRPQTDTNFDVLQYPIFRIMCPEKTDDEFESMRTVVCGWLFGNLEIPQA